MNRAEALAEARRRWGEDATVWITSLGRLYCVEVIGGGPHGSSFKGWEAAFADADRRAVKP